MSPSHRYQLRVPEPQHSELEAFARQHGLAVCPAIRLLLGRGLREEERRPFAPTALQDSPAALASLVASEHALLMVASVLPEGQRRMNELAVRAATAAEERLALFRESDQ